MRERESKAERESVIYRVRDRVEESVCVCVIQVNRG